MFEDLPLDEYSWLLPPEERARTVVVGKITRILTIQAIGEATKQPWLELLLGEKQEAGTGRFPRFKMGEARYYVPLGWHGWSIARRIGLCADPTNRGMVLYNYRMVWYLGDKWPSKHDPPVDDDGGNGVGR